MSSPSSITQLRGGARLFAMLALTVSLSACDFVSGYFKPKQTPEEAKAEGIALGAGCRQAGQSLEDCYQRNPDKLKAGIFAGWKDMHEYMAAKNIPTVAPPPPEKTEADAAKDSDKKDTVQDDRAARRERRERERADREKESKAKDSDSDRSSRRSRDRDDSGSRS